MFPPLLWPSSGTCITKEILQFLKQLPNIRYCQKQTTKAQRGSRCIALHFLQPLRYMGWVVNAKARPLYPR
jgi:hypothetical protein